MVAVVAFDLHFKLIGRYHPLNCYAVALTRSMKKKRRML
ncbi:hypothetical protein APS_2738 [Acetobacter pasteurianus subsp. pasteurianus LMG 1262 = NBRC 106471]|nr:hypothetical protein APS_2738 [Acetobacter pasteurianus subsp. pasteurianus LMG 1262 = NBRC 106471]